MTSPHVRPGEVLAGRYRVDRELGAGAMGVVYAAWHLDLDHPVAIKVVTAPITDVEAATARFRREVRAAAKIRSEHVSRVLDVGSLDSGVPYMVLELLEGNDLETELERHGPVAVGVAVDYILQAIEALAEAHAAGIVHRDLKPANLFLAERADKTRIIKVLDFGISKSVLGDSAPGQLSLTQTGVMMGSPLYMSPEQMQSTRDTDARCDIWALGVVLYQLLSGTLPFRGDNILELCASVFRDRPAPLSNFRSDVPLELESVIAKCLARERDHRYQNVAELAAALADFAPSHASIHRDRAFRVLFPKSSGSTSPSYGAGFAPSYANSATPVVRSLSDSNAGAGTDRNAATKASPMYHAMAPQTQAAWNAAGPPKPTRLRKRVGGTLVLAFLGVSVLLGYLRFSPSAALVSSEHAATPTNSAAPVEAAGLLPEAPARPTREATAAAVSIPSVTPLGSAEAGNGEPTSLSKSTLPTSTPNNGQLRSNPKPAVTGITKPAASKSPAVGTTRSKDTRRTDGSELPDYGGRR